MQRPVVFGPSLARPAQRQQDTGRIRQAPGPGCEAVAFPSNSGDETIPNIINNTATFTRKHEGYLGGPQIWDSKAEESNRIPINDLGSAGGQSVSPTPPPLAVGIFPSDTSLGPIGPLSSLI